MIKNYNLFIQSIENRGKGEKIFQKVHFNNFNFNAYY